MAKSVPQKTESAREMATRTPSGGVRQLDESELEELQGVENVGYSESAEDRGTPLLYIAQKMSKQVDSKAPEYIEGLKVGMAFNNLTGRYWDAENEGIEVLVFFFRPNWNEWTPRSEGGGFHGSHPRDTPLVREGHPLNINRNTGKPLDSPRRDIIVLPNGHELILTHHYFTVLREQMQPIIIPMSSTNLGASKKLQALIEDNKVQTGDGRIVRAPAYWQKFLLKTFYTKNDQGDWYKWIVTPAGSEEDRSVRNFCKELAIAAMRGDIKVADPLQEDGGGSGEEFGLNDPLR